MMSVAVNQELLQSAVAAMPQDELTSIRTSAANEFLRDGLPGTRHEDWKYTNLSPVAEIGNAWLERSADRDLAQAIPDAACEQLRRLQSEIDAHWFVVSDGQILARDCDSNFTAPGSIEITRLAEQPPEGGIDASDSITQLNAALLRNGVRLSVAAGHEPTVRLAFLIVGSNGVEPSMSQNRFVVEVANSASIQLIQAHWPGQGEARFVNSVTELRLQSGARADLVQINESGQEYHAINTVLVNQSNDSQFRFNTFDFGAALVRNDVRVSIDGPGADTRMHGLYLASEGQHVDNHTRVDHRVGPATSDETYRGILGRRARCVFNGKAVVHAGADGTDANQANHNLLLSDQAEIDTKPELEIYADDVKCSHGATVGQLDRSALFYLRSRGLTESEAEAVLTRAFASSALSNLCIEECREYLAKAVETRLDQIITENRQPEASVK